MLKKIRLELGRTADRPAGDPDTAYQITAPLDRSGHLDAEGWRANYGRCVVIYFTPGAVANQGLLIRTRNNDWAFSYGADDEPSFLLRSNIFRIGEYVSISGRDGKSLPFKVVSIADA